MRTVAIIQARMGSNRLPGKVLMDLAGKPMLGHIIDRLRLCKNVDETVVATTEHEWDLPVVEFVREYGCPYFLGSEENVLKRIVGAGEKYKAETIVRVTADCPLIDPETIDRMVAYHNKIDADFTACHFEIPNLIQGAGVVSLRALQHTLRISNRPEDLEHVTFYIVTHLSAFKVGSITPPAYACRSDLRLTVDNEEDMVLMRKIFGCLYKENTIVQLRDVVRLLDENPQLKAINSNIRNKPTSEIYSNMAGQWVKYSVREQ